MKDSEGNEIQENCILRVFHFINRYKRRKEYMYKQVGEYCEKIKRFKVYHLPIDLKNLEKDAYYFMDDEQAKDCIVVNCPFDMIKDDGNLKRSKIFRD